MAFWSFVVARALRQAGLSWWLPSMARVAKPPPLLRAPHLSSAQRISQPGPAQQGDDLFYGSFPRVGHDQQSWRPPIAAQEDCEQGRALFKST